MKKTTLVVLILAVSLILAGGVLAGIGASKGGAVKLYWDMEKRQVVPYEREGKLF